MASLNQIQLIGNLGKDPEIRYLPSGDPVATFSVATTETWKNKQGEKQEKTEWHRVEAIGKLAEVVESYATKGSKVFVQGKMVYDEWTDKDGNKRTMAKVKIDFGGKFVLLGGGAGKPSSKADAPASAGSDEDAPF